MRFIRRRTLIKRFTCEVQTIILISVQKYKKNKSYSNKPTITVRTEEVLHIKYQYNGLPGVNIVAQNVLGPPLAGSQVRGTASSSSKEAPLCITACGCNSVHNTQQASKTYLQLFIWAIHVWLRRVNKRCGGSWQRMSCSLVELICFHLPPGP